MRFTTSTCGLKRPEEAWSCFLLFPGSSTSIRSGVECCGNVLKNISIPTLLLFPMGAYRRGSALDILLDYGRLAQRPGARLGEESDPLKVLFLTLMRGRRGYEFLQHRILPGTSGDPFQEMADEFRRLQRALRWNPLLQFMRVCGLQSLLLSLYLFILGMSFEHHRGVFRLVAVAIGLLHLLALRYRDYVPIPSYVWGMAMIYGLQVTMRGLATPALPTHLDSVLVTPLDYAFARTEDGYLVLVPHNAVRGDNVALLQGSECPFIVRSGGTCVVARRRLLRP